VLCVDHGIFGTVSAGQTILCDLGLGLCRNRLGLPVCADGFMCDLHFVHSVGAVESKPVQGMIEVRNSYKNTWDKQEDIGGMGYESDADKKDNSGCIGGRMHCHHAGNPGTCGGKSED
jgi:hypothetical protein